MLTGKGVLLGSLAGVVVGQMQIIKIVMSQISWSPELPRWLVDFVESLGSLLSINIPSFISSPECMAELQPLEKWSLNLAFPLVFVLVFILWYAVAKCHFKQTKKYDPEVIQTILAGAVNVLLIGKSLVKFHYYVHT